MPGERPRSGVIAPGAGVISTRGPVHFERRATTSASRERSAKAAFGCDLICRQAASQGIVSVVLSGSDMRREDVSCAEVGGAAFEVGVWPARSPPARPQLPGFPQQAPPVEFEQVRPLPPPLSDRQGQSLQGDEHATDLLIAAQKALPNASSAQAGQFDGSPVQVGTSGFGGAEVGREMGKMGCRDGLWVRRLSGMGGW